MTEKLYLEDSALTVFRARVLERRPGAVVLDRTAFYATSGGQPHDIGTLAGVPVTGVEAEGDQVVHTVAGEVPDGEVEGRVDAPRRRDHLEQHHGQHILSRAFIDECGAPTVSFHLGPVTSTIDLELRDLADAEVLRAEDLANRVVLENRAVTATWHTVAEARALGLRKLPDGLERVRVVTIRDFDRCGCGGTHPARTGEIGQIRVLGWERTKGKVRLEFVCGGRALRDGRERARALAAAAAAFGCPPLEAAQAARKAASELKDRSRELDILRRRFADLEAAELLAAAASSRLARGRFPDRDVASLLLLARSLSTTPGTAFVLTGNGALVAGHGDGVSLNIAGAFQEAVEAGGLRGGGRGKLFQAAGAADPDALEAAAATLASRLARELVP